MLDLVHSEARFDFFQEFLGKAEGYFYVCTNFDGKLSEKRIIFFEEPEDLDKDGAKFIESILDKIVLEEPLFFMNIYSPSFPIFIAAIAFPIQKSA